jgi:hypothetical protein
VYQSQTCFGNYDTINIQGFHTAAILMWLSTSLIKRRSSILATREGCTVFRSVGVLAGVLCFFPVAIFSMVSITDKIVLLWQE